MNENQNTVELVEVEAVIKATNAIAVQDEIKVALVRDLGPIAARLSGYAEMATLPVKDQVDANWAAQVLTDMTNDIKAVKNHEVMSKITNGLFKLHRQWTGAMSMFVTPLEASHRTLKNKVIAWQESERQKAAAEQAKLQAEADERARKEREALEKKAASMKTEAKREEYRKAAAAVIAPVVHVEAPKSAVKMQTRWKVKAINMQLFLEIATEDENLQGFIEIKMANLERAKAANPNLMIPGVEFHKVTV